MNEGRTNGDYRQVWISGTGQVITGVHSPDVCAGEPCVIHNPSDHHMRDWPTNLRDDFGSPFTERICGHGVGHPDPDDPQADRVHACCGCCARPEDS